MDPPNLTEEGTEAAGATDWPFLLYLAGEAGPEGGERVDLAEWVHSSLAGWPRQA